MNTLHLVSHTHWDREWYLTFQQFRFKLLHLIDHLLDLLDSDPTFQHFTLDGQTILLDDYLEIRPERLEALRRRIASGRILIGPWYVLADEFLVSGEAHIRNLLEGQRTARRLGGDQALPLMQVGYLPDTFGHIGQMPQILRGFGLQSAAAMRGIPDAPCEFWWQAADGSRVLMANLREGYSNAAGLPTHNPPYFAQETVRTRQALAPHAAGAHLLLMHGSDHLEPPADTSAAVAYANQNMPGDRLLHSTLPAYFAALQQEDLAQIPTIAGELRSPQRHPLLPGVLSMRTEIKQRNQACETLLERWAEPFSLWAELLNPTEAAHSRQPLVQHAWRLLMQCHPHDSICATSIDQVHAEMRPRFEQVEQIGEEVTRDSLEALAAAVDTRPADGAAGRAVVVFNPTSQARSEPVSFEYELGPNENEVEIFDDAGRRLPHQFEGLANVEVFNVAADRRMIEDAVRLVQDGRIMGMIVRTFNYRREGETVYLNLTLANHGSPDLPLWEHARRTLEELMADPGLKVFVARGVAADAGRITFLAGETPGHGYRTFWARGVSSEAAAKAPQRVPSWVRLLLPLAAHLPQMTRRTRQVAPIENEFFHVAAQADGAVTLTDKRSGLVYAGLNRFVDGGDSGDEYNYCPPEQDTLAAEAVVQEMRRQAGPARQTMEIRLALKVPRALDEARRARSTEQTTLEIVTRLSLSPGVARLEVSTEVKNRAEDHRLRVHFPTPFGAAECGKAAEYDGQFEIVRRPFGAPPSDPSWAEQPRPEQAQCAFSAVRAAQHGLLIANRGLPEAEAFANPQGQAEIAVTLLRCVGWLSRTDLATRPGNAGPCTPTPEAQQTGRHVFEYAIIPLDNQRLYETYQEAYAFNAPLRASAAALHAGTLPASAALASSSDARFPLSALKAAENGRGWVARGYNLSAQALEARLTPWRRFGRAEVVGLDEQPRQALAVAADGSVTLQVEAHQIVSVKFYDD